MERRLAILLATAACSRVSATSPDASETIDADTTPLPDAGGVTAFDVRIFDATATTPATGTLCVVDQPDCETSDAGGHVTVSVIGDPADLKLAFVAAVAGHLSTVELGRIYLQLDDDTYTVPTDVGLLPDADAAALVTSAGFDYPATSTGFIRLTVLDGMKLGAELGGTVTLDGSNDAPVYLDSTGRPDLSLTSIGPSGGVLFGGVPPGPFSLTLHHGTRACLVQSFGWEASGSSSLTGVVVAGALTDAATLACYDTQ